MSDGRRRLRKGTSRIELQTRIRAAVRIRISTLKTSTVFTSGIVDKQSRVSYWSCIAGDSIQPERRGEVGAGGGGGDDQRPAGAAAADGQHVPRRDRALHVPAAAALRAAHAVHAAAQGHQEQEGDHSNVSACARALDRSMFTDLCMR